MKLSLGEKCSAIMYLKLDPVALSMNNNYDIQTSLKIRETTRG